MNYYEKFVNPLYPSITYWTTAVIIFICLVFIAGTDNSIALTANEIKAPSGIVINEILPSPEGPDEKEEWIEFFNQNDFEVILSGWQIRDTAGKTKTYTLSNKKTVPAKGFLVLLRPETKITLNNDSDGLDLVQPNGEIIDTVGYKKAPQGKSYNRTASGWVWSSALTPGKPNIVQTPQTQQLEENKKDKKGLAAIKEQFPEKASLFVLITALVAAIFSGAIILILKNKLRKFDLSKK